MRSLLPILLSALCFAARMPAQDLNRALDHAAETYVKLVLAVGLHDADYVDAYYGPAEWKSEVEKRKPGLPTIRKEADGVLAELQRLDPSGAIELVRLRHQYLLKQLESLEARIDILRGKKMTFDEESAALYDAVAPHYSESHFQQLLARLDPLLPGPGSLAERYQAFDKSFAVPKDKLDAVFRAAIDEARRRTLRHIHLPAGESFSVEYVTGQVWSAYNWYKGSSHSLIQVNTDFPVTIDFAVHLACHEGYPGHHVYNALLENRLAKQRGWKEFTVYPLYSPQSLIAEGSAEFGVSVVLPEPDQVEFFSKTLFPLAGLDPAQVKRFLAVKKLAAELNYAGNEAARGYLDGKFGKDEAIRWLTTYALMSPERAAQRIRFFDKNRSYVINYNLGQDLVKQYMERRGATPANPAKLWKELDALLSSPRLPSGLR
jgi:hypothetical protein